MENNNKNPNKVEQMLASLKIFCKKKLNREYYDLCKFLLDELLDVRRFNLEKEDSKLLSASIVLAICTINFTFDKNYKPFIIQDDIFDYFKVDSSTALNKEKQIRELLDIHYLNSFYSIERIIKNSPLKDLVILDDELIHLSNLPTKIQQKIQFERECYTDVILKRGKKDPKIIKILPIVTEPHKTYKKFFDFDSFKTTSFDVFCFKITTSLIVNILSQEN